MRRSRISLLRVGHTSLHIGNAEVRVGDQHLLAEAPAYALHRLRKAELIRLWKVAGMWGSEVKPDGESVASMADDEDEGDLGKKQLVDGLIAAVSWSMKLPSCKPRTHAPICSEIAKLRLCLLPCLHLDAKPLWKPPSRSNDFEAQLRPYQHLRKLLRPLPRVIKALSSVSTPHLMRCLGRGQD